MNRLLALGSLGSYSIDCAKLETLLRIFYAVVAYFSCMHFCQVVLIPDYGHAQWAWPVAWLSHVPMHATLLAILISGMVAHFAAALLIYNRALKFISCALFFLLTAVDASFGHFSFALLGLLYCGFCFAFIQAPTVKQATQNARFYFFSAQLVFLTLYSLSGLWKIIGLVLSMRGNLWWTIDPLTYSIHMEQMQQFSSRPGLVLIPTSVGFLLWAGVIAIETLSVAIAFYPGLQRFWGCAIFALHTGAAIIMNVHYWPNMVLAGMILIGHPYERIQKACPKGDA